MANSDLVSIDPLRLSTLSFIIHLRLMGTDGGWRGWGRTVLCMVSLAV